MDLQTYIRGLDPEAREAFAAKAGTTVMYLYQLAGGHRTPSDTLARSLHLASKGAVSLHSLRPQTWPPGYTEAA